MQKKRKLSLSICDYQRKVVCPLYDSQADVSGQATDIYVTTERNGWKELSFSLPSTCQTEAGIEENFRLNYLKADYLIRLIDEEGTDWYIISEPKITHEAYSKKIDVTAGHIAQLLKVKNYGLEFSDKEGNNVGTAQELLTTILDGTGWSVGYVYPFAEKDGKTKYRSLKASAKTGTFKLITTLCDLFEAKPVYHGDSRKVDLYPINPFSQPEAGQLPDLSLADGVAELHYGKNLRNVTRTMNTENMVTKLYAYGSYGDKTSGYCGIDECEHTEYVYTVTNDCAAGEYYFAYTDETGIRVVRHFSSPAMIHAGDVLIFSTMDPAAMSYLWNETQGIMYPVSSGTQGTALPANMETKSDVKNYFQFLMDFDYYREVGLLTDDMLQTIAQYQREAPKLFAQISQASAQLSDARTKLSQTIGVVDYCRLAIDRDEPLLDDQYITLVLDKTQGTDGVLYRTDYDQIKKNQFKWRATDSLNKDGDPVNEAAGIVYILHDTNPITWDKAYLKKVFYDNNEDEPEAITLWAARGTITINPAKDKFYLFAYNSINGYLGTLEAADESACKALSEATKLVTVEHPVQFVNAKNASSALPQLSGYGWRWVYFDDKSPSQFYFCYEEEGDTSWRKVLFQNQRPNPSDGGYWYDWRNSVLYRSSGGNWVLLDTASEKRVAALFPTVFMYGKTRDKYYQGLAEQYICTVPAGQTLPAGNYFMENEYSSYWALTTQDELKAGDTLRYEYSKGWVTQAKDKVDTILSTKAYRFDNVSYHVDNLLQGREVESGGLDSKGELIETEETCKTQGFYPVVPKTEYISSRANMNATVHYYDDKKRWLSCEAFTTSFTTPSDCGFICIVFGMTKAEFDAMTDYTISAKDKENLLIIKDLNYKRLSPVVSSGDNMGILRLMDSFSTLSDLTYQTYYAALKDLQEKQSEMEKNMTSTIGDLYREGWWQDDSYVDGDEKKLYDDALKNLKQIAKPEATYGIQYLDLYGADEGNSAYGAAKETTLMRWPDISMASAVHLIDPEIAINTWAYFDKIKKCYDQPQKTQIAINTNLSTISQHSFGDVLTNIANVASRMKGNESYYDKTLESTINKGEIEDVNASIVQTDKKLNNTLQSVEQIGDVLIYHETTIKQTQDEISATVARSTEDSNRFSSQLKLTAEAITSEVERAKKEEGTLSTQISQSASKIELAVQTANNMANGTTPVPKVKNSSLTIDTDGIAMQAGKINLQAHDASGNPTSEVDISSGAIDMAGGKISIKAKDASSDEDNVVEIGEDGIIMKAGTSFVAESGGGVKINAQNEEDSYITFGDMFSATQTGGVRAKSASFDDAYVQGSAIITEKTLGQKIVVSVNQPEGHGILWFIPSATTSVSYSKQTDVDRNSSLIFSGGNNYVSRQTLSANTSDVLGNGSYTYVIEYTLYMIDGGSKSEANLKMNVVLSKGDKAVAFETTAVPYMSVWKEVTIRQTVTSDVNLCESADTITATFTLAGYNYYHIYLQANSWINLTCTNTSVTAEKMPCSIYYLP